MTFPYDSARVQEKQTHKLSATKQETETFQKIASSSAHACQISYTMTISPNSFALYEKVLSRKIKLQDP